MDFYRPHPKDDGRLYFHFVCQSTPGGGGGGGEYPVSVKGKNFDTRFGLIHVQTGKEIFLSRDPPPPPPHW